MFYAALFSMIFFGGQCREISSNKARHKSLTNEFIFFNLKSAILDLHEVLLVFVVVILHSHCLPCLCATDQHKIAAQAMHGKIRVKYCRIGFEERALLAITVWIDARVTDAVDVDAH